eukprot:1185842-Prorocentrum_minimum.AAC.4
MKWLPAAETQVLFAEKLTPGQRAAFRLLHRDQLWKIVHAAAGGEGEAAPLDETELRNGCAPPTNHRRRESISPEREPTSTPLAYCDHFDGFPYDGLGKS